jgi:sterol desaturase/sphingolipid hydroxylase (fatty acid hydroxylase superfamily)
MPAYWQATCFLGGWAGWTLSEYLLHRFAFHRKHPSPWLGGRHTQHHKEMDRFTFIRGALPVWMGGLAAVWGLAWLLLGASAPWAFAGYAAGGLWYEILHHLIHLRPRWVPKRWVGYHLAHHQRRPGRQFGVTTRFWDQVLGTR